MRHTCAPLIEAELKGCSHNLRYAPYLPLDESDLTCPRGLGVRYSPRVHSHRRRPQRSRDTPHCRPRLQGTDPRLYSSSFRFPVHLRPKIEIPHRKVLNQTCVLRVNPRNSRVSPAESHIHRVSTQSLQPETHLPPQLLPFNANEHLNTAPSVR